MALLLALAAILLFSIFAARAHKTLLLALPAIALVLAGLLYFNPTIYHRQVETTETIVSRVGDSVYGLIWKTGLAIARDHPAFGVGVRNYQTACLDERYGPLLVGPDEFKRCQGHPHNIYLQWLAETGAVGLVLYCAFAALALAAVIRAAPAHRGDLLFGALAICLALRFWPLATTTSFYSSWSTAPLFLILGWTLAFRPQETGDG
jgi:O-antigen ligase